MFSFFKPEVSAPSVGKAIALMNQKGGVGKTTMAFNLAHAYKHQGKKVLCIDMDPQGNFSSLFGVDGVETHIYHLLINSLKELKALHSPAMFDDVKVATSEGIDLIPSGQALSGFELTVAGINAPRQLILKKFIEKHELRSRYDVIVIDGPPTLGLLVVNILCATDGVLYPFVPDRFSEQGLKNIQQVVADIAEMEITSTPKNLGYIPNLFDVRRKQANSDFEQIRESLGEATVHEAFTNKVQFGKSLAQRKSVFHFKSVEYKDLQRQFTVMTETVQKELFMKTKNPLYVIKGKTVHPVYGVMELVMKKLNLEPLVEFLLKVANFILQQVKDYPTYLAAKKAVDEVMEKLQHLKAKFHWA